MWIQKVPGGGVEGLAYSPDGRTLYTADRSGWVTAWDTASHTGRKCFRLEPEVERCNFIHLHTLGERTLLTHGLHWIVWDVAKGAEDHRVPIEFTQRVLKHDQSKLYSRGADADSVVTWEFETHRQGKALDGWNLVGGLRSFDISRDGRTAVLTDTDRYVTLFDLETKQELDRFEPTFPSSELQGARFLPREDGLLLRAGHRLRFWDVEKRITRGEIVVSSWFSWVVVFHPTEPVFAGLNPKQELTLFHLDNARPIRSLDFALGRFVQCVAFSPDGLTCAVGGSNKQFAVFDVDL